MTSTLGIDRCQRNHHTRETTSVANYEQMSYRGFLAELLLAECDDRARRRSERRITAAKFPVDRLTFGGTIIETGTDSYRLAQSTKLVNA